MFTGIVEEKGILKAIKKGAMSAVVHIGCKKVLEGTNIGDSIAVNGICLTVTSLMEDEFTADVMAETMRRSSIGELSIGDEVNLERAMPATGRFGGHIVSGHIDDIGIISNVSKDETAVWFTISADEKVLRYIVEKGSIAIDGISLTVAYVDDKCFKVSVIKHTQAETTLTHKKCGAKVNLECDICAKYIEKLCKKTEDDSQSDERIMKALTENGFI